MTRGRRCSGVRAVRTPKSGPLTSGAKNVAAKSAAKTAAAGGSKGSSQSGAAKARIANPASRSGGTRRTTKIAQMLPASAPAASDV